MFRAGEKKSCNVIFNIFSGFIFALYLHWMFCDSIPTVLGCDYPLVKCLTYRCKVYAPFYSSRAMAYEGMLGKKKIHMIKTW